MSQVGWHDRWNRLAVRERRLLLLAVWLVGAVVLWLALLAPALKVWRTAPAQSQALDAQLQHMSTLQMQAKALQQQAPLGYEDALRALNNATKESLGSNAQVSIVAERATVSVQVVPADALAQWLQQMRLNARSTPVEARLTRIVTASGVAWSGVLVMALPPR